MSADSDAVLLMAESNEDLVALKALKLLLEEAEPQSHFSAPQLYSMVWAAENYGRLRILHNEGGHLCDSTHDTLLYFRRMKLPIAYHRLILTTTAG